MGGAATSDRPRARPRPSLRWRTRRAYKDYDRATPTACSPRLRRAGRTCEANPQNIPAIGFNGEQWTDDADRLWAAAELFRATKKPVYEDYFLARYQGYAYVWASTTDNAAETPMRAFLAYNSAPERRRDRRASGSVRGTRRWRERPARAHAGRPGATSSTTAAATIGSDYYWGSNSVTLQEIVVIALADRASADEIDPELVKAARAQLNYVLGVNPLRKSYVTGLRRRRPGADLLVIYSNDGIAALPPGILAEGPNQYQGWRYSRFFGKCYADTNTDWTVSEHAIYYNANLVFVLALAEATSAVQAY